MSLAFAKLSELNHKFILEKMLEPSPVETMSTGGDVAFEGFAPKVVSMEAPATVPMAPRSPLKPTHSRETQTTKPKKDKQKNPLRVRESLRKHSTTQAKQKKDKQPKKVVDLEAEEGQGIEDIDVEGA